MREDIVTDLQGSPKPATPERESSRGAKIRYPGLGTMFLFWTAIGALSSVRYSVFMPSRPGAGIDGLSLMLGHIACYYPWIPLTPLVFRLEKRFPLGTDRWTRNLAVLAIFSVPICLVAAPLMLGGFLAVFYVLRVPLGIPLIKIHWYKEFPVAEFIFWCSAAGGYFIRTLFQLREQERATARLALEKSQLEAGLNQAQLEVLRARLNPHFLFNSLQNISVMTKQDPQTASRMLTRLGDLLRAALGQDSQPECTLRDEIKLTRAYVALEQMRFGDRLRVDFEIPREAQRAMVPCFLLQPLVENAVVHGLRGARKTGIITVSGASQADELVLMVTDNGVGPPAEDPAGMKTGIGLRSTCERLARMYPDRHTFSIRKPAEGGAEVRITIPLRFGEVEDRDYHDEQTSTADR